MKTIWGQLKELKEEDDLKVIEFTADLIIEEVKKRFGGDSNYFTEDGPSYILPDGKFLAVNFDEYGEYEDIPTHMNVNLFLGTLGIDISSGGDDFFAKETGSIAVGFFPYHDSFINLNEVEPNQKQYKSLEKFVSGAIENELILLIRGRVVNKEIRFDFQDNNYSDSDVIEKIKSYY